MSGRRDVPKLRDRMWPVLGRLMGAHVVLYRATGGLIGHRFPGVPPMLLLHHVGAKTGMKRVTALSYIRDGDDIVIVASKGGHPKHPAWLHNLRAHPDVEVQVGRDHLEVRAREATSEEHDRLWPRVVEAYDGYRSYQERTKRLIPLVVLEPR